MCTVPAGLITSGASPFGPPSIGFSAPSGRTPCPSGPSNRPTLGCRPIPAGGDRRQAVAGKVGREPRREGVRPRLRLHAPGALQPHRGGAGEALLGFFRDNLHDHLAAAVGNLLAGPGDLRAFERAVYYNRLRPEDVAALEAEARTLALAAMRHLNSPALERQQAARGDPAARERFRFGAFFHQEAEPVGPGPDPASPAEAPPDSSKEPP